MHALRPGPAGDAWRTLGRRIVSRGRFSSRWRTRSDLPMLTGASIDGTRGRQVAGGKSRPERVYDAIDSGVLAMDAYVFN